MADGTNSRKSGCILGGAWNAPDAFGLDVGCVLRTEWAYANICIGDNPDVLEFQLAEEQKHSRVHNYPIAERLDPW